MKIAFYQDNDNVITVHPAPALFDAASRDRIELAERGVIFNSDEEVYDFIFSKDIPKSKIFYTILESELPDLTFRNAWIINAGSLEIDLSKAKNITHVKRRAARAEEFKPLDEIISLQIPGNDLSNAELQRQLIRDKYADIQQQIDACEDVESLKSIHESLGAQ